MFGIGMPEFILIMVVALIVIGPKKLPDLARSLGRALGEFKKATREFKESIEIDQQMGDLKKAFDDIHREGKPTSPCADSRQNPGDEIPALSSLDKPEGEKDTESADDS